MSEKEATGFLKGKKVAVLMGGPGREREVSLRSGAAVCRALETLGAEVVAVDVRGPDFSLPENLFLAFNALHGTYGEDGDVQAELERRGVSYTGEGVEQSRVAFDKIQTKEKFLAAGVPTVSWKVLNHPGEEQELSIPCVVKAPRQGSSVGVHIVKDSGQLPTALEDCFSLDEQVLVEEFFPGRELTVGILGGVALPVVEIVPKGGFYDYEHKYTVGGSDYFVPARLPSGLAAKVQKTALLANQALGLQVYCRVDVMADDQGNLNVLEINTIPGMTETSLLPKAAAAAGVSFPVLCEKIAELSVAVRKGGRVP